ncbi:MAG: hypothetical protein HC820_07390 [Hydrococcus sp. RM1_1_31]|nr:hypothetical protein [Hydrococcus sp. RM1_1_31]
MSRDFIYTSKRQICPVCDRDHGCKLFDDGKVWCLRVTNQSDIPPNYRVVGWLDNGMGAFLVPSSDEDDLEYRRKRALREEKLQRQQQGQLSTLSVEQRDKAIRRMHSQIGLSRSDRILLKQTRGMTDEQIDRGLYFSLAPYQDLPAAIPLNFPGVHSSRKTLTNKYQGIACPLFDSQGRAIAIQVRVTDEKAEGGKYRWLKDSHLSNGELPLTFIRPQNLVRKQLALVEGTGFKPLLAADKLRQIVIGASGGQHRGSPQQLGEYFKAAEAVGINVSSLQVYLDAGDIVNPHVMKRLVNLVDLLESWSKQVEIAWWRQETKGSPDIDELDDVNEIAYIPAAQFQPLQDFKAEEGRRQEDGAYKLAKTLRSYAPPEGRRIKTSSNRKLFQQKVGGILNPIREGNNNLFPSASCPLPSAFLDKIERTWEKLTSLSVSPWKRINKPQLEPSDLATWEKGHIYLVVSAKGTGKTKSIKSVVDKFSNAIAPNARRSLARTLAHNLELTHLDDLKSFTGSLKVSCCLDSLWQLSPGVLRTNGVFLLDEIDQVLVHAFGQTCNKDGKRPRILKHFEACLAAALADGLVVGMSADITDSEVALLQNLLNSLGLKSEVRIVLNEYQPPKGDCYYFTDESPDGLIEQLVRDLRKGKNVYLIDDTKNGIRGCELFKVWVAELGRRYEANKSLFPGEIKDWYNRNYNANAKFLQSVLVDYNPLTDEWTSPWFEYQCKVFAYQNLCMADYRRLLKERLEGEGIRSKKFPLATKLIPIYL